MPEPLAHMYTKAPHTNAYFVPNNVQVTNELSGVYDATKLFDLALFRISPHWIKRYIYNDQLWFVQSALSNEAYMGLASFSHTAFLRDMQENMSVRRNVPVYKLVHLMLSHNPMVADEECNYAGKNLPAIRYRVKIQARCNLVETVRSFDEMGFKGIYDSTTIVLVADHGTFAKAKGIKGSVDDDGNYAGNLDARVISLVHPLMAIKLANASGPLVTPSVYSSITGTTATIVDSSVLDTGS